MPPLLALLISVTFVFLAFRAERKRLGKPSPELVWPTLWYLATTTRPLGSWLYLWGLPVPGASDDPTDGSMIDRYFFTAIAMIGFAILLRRRFDWAALCSNNPWLTTFFVLMAASILWSQYPFVSFKRYIRMVGSVLMALVVLVNARPLEAILTVLRHGLYVHLPMSILCIKYFRHIGVSFDWNGVAESWQGIATSKNDLGQVAMLGVICFLWELRRNWQLERWKSFNLPYLLMACYLIKGSEESVSLTSVTVCVLAVTIFLRLQSFRSRVACIKPFAIKAFFGTAGLIALILTHSIVMFRADSLFGYLITKFGRDITLTDRTNIWHDVYAVAASHQIFGVGFGGFWIGRLANIPWNANMTWVLGQAHSGYIDTYLQLGLIGSFLLSAVLLSTLPHLIDSAYHNFDFSSLRITLFITILFINITESTFLRGDHHLWFVMQLVLWRIPTSGIIPGDEITATSETIESESKVETLSDIDTLAGAIRANA